MFSYDFPYPSQRMPVMARNAVATSQPLAAQAGLQMLQRGGNAVDAAIATAIALTVVEPTSNGIGGDAFAILWDGGELHGLNASGRSPAALTLEHFAGRTSLPLRGWDAVTVPGAVSGWVTLSERFGKLPFEALFEPAVRYAREGFLVSPITAKAWAFAEKTFADMPEFVQAFLPGAAPPDPASCSALKIRRGPWRRSLRAKARRSTGATLRKSWPRTRRRRAGCCVRATWTRTAPTG
jgi:gamma-glutamyltranspeptidase / glutathione hydrolase